MPKRPDPIVRAVRIEAGKLYLGDGTERGESLQRRLYAGAVKHLPDGPYELTLAPFEETRRARANRWLFGVLYKTILTEMQGIVTEGAKLGLHDAMTLRHCPEERTNLLTGEVTRVGRRTHLMKIGEFSDFIEAVMFDGAEMFGISWPEPRKSEEWREPRGKAEAA